MVHFVIHCVFTPAGIRFRHREKFLENEMFTVVTMERQQYLAQKFVLAVAFSIYSVSPLD